MKPPEADKTRQPPPPPSPGLNMFFKGLAITLLIIVILALAGGVLFSLKTVTVSKDSPMTPVITPAAASPAAATPPVIIPANGVWVRVAYNGSYIGWVGNPGALQHVGGSGDRFYMIPDQNGLVQVSFSKQDYTGRPLAIGVYRNGTAIYSRTVTAPMGSIDFIIDAKTGEFPGSTPTPASSSGGLVPGQIYRY